MSNDPSEVMIHKRNRNRDENTLASSSQSSDLSAYEAPKKKKYKIISNDFVSQTSTALSTTVDSPPQPVDVLDIDSKLPKDRKDLLHFVSAKYI